MTDIDRRQIFHREVEPHIPYLQTFAMQLVRNRLDAEDLTQLTCLKAYTSLDLYEPGTNARGWLVLMMRRLAINEWKRQQRLLRFGMDPVVENQYGEQYTLEAKSVDPDPLDRFSDEVSDALNALRDGERQAFVMWYIEEEARDDIAESLDARPGTVKSRCHHARVKLERKLTEYGRSQGFTAIEGTVRRYARKKGRKDQMPQGGYYIKGKNSGKELAL